jgi:hypothetical protein
MKPLILMALLCALPAYAQDDGMPWQTDASFAAVSNTSMSITGDISISGDDAEKTLTTASGTEIFVYFVEDRSSGWSLSDNEVWPGGVFAVEEDPGQLENGNTLCGSDEATYVVFTPFDDQPAGPYLQMAVFSGDAPENIESAGLCGTLNYALD